MPKVFGVIKDITLFGYVIRTFVVGIIAFLTGRFMLKRSINQLTAYDFILVWILGALTVAPLLDGEVSFTYTIVPLVTLFFWHFFISLISQKNRKVSQFFNGKPVILIDNGKIIKESMKKHFINIDLLMSELRLKNVFDISEVKFAVLETNGHLSVIKKENLRPVTPPDLSITAKPSDLPLIIINDGILFEDNLAKSGVDKNWLMTNLSMYNVSDISSVLLATIDKSKRLYVRCHPSHISHFP